MCLSEFLFLCMTWGIVHHTMANGIGYDSDKNVKSHHIKCKFVSRDNSALIKFVHWGCNTKELTNDISPFYQITSTMDNNNINPFDVEYSLIARLITWHLMPWFIASPRHQQSWYYRLYMINPYPLVPHKSVGELIGAKPLPKPMHIYCYLDP